ncbi:hypothetical protein FE845_03000 [Marinobacter sp. 1-4A]|uniref:DUF6447 family protein n=1 Tax=Marinobacter sp. 1-4A TaxID=2582919 RepID=UPI0019084612|nr:DUF6447 family protein [Marinobacter sp. 1-4A]MBK1850290.1 hypothetical protein [Marinobacter sp. 1-4A]
MTESKKTTSAGKKSPATGSTAKTAARKTPAKKAAAPKKAAASKASASPQVNIDGKTYDLNSLSEKAQAQINNLRATDRLINELELELAIARTARGSYSENLERELLAMNTTLQ